MIDENKVHNHYGIKKMRKMSSVSQVYFFFFFFFFFGGGWGVGGGGWEVGGGGGGGAEIATGVLFQYPISSVCETTSAHRR